MHLKRILPAFVLLSSWTMLGWADMASTEITAAPRSDAVQVRLRDWLQSRGVTDAAKLAQIEELWKLIQRHQTYTKSERAAMILADWKKFVPKFVKVMPQDYARVLASLKKVQSQGLSGDEAIMAAFIENVKGGH